ncbi:MAG TPA: exonuclease SbcCD subunit D [Actinomycetota bacterium]
MRILHTADWHVGKKLGRVDRRAEFEQVFDEIVAIARDQKVDLVIVAGDLLDRAFAPYDAISLVLDVLRRLADAAGHVVVIAGNHDSVALLDLLAPWLRDLGILLVPHIRRPSEGGVLTVPSRDGTETAAIAAFPFLHEAEVVDFMQESEEWFKTYDQKVQRICTKLCDALDPEAVRILTGHFFVDKAELGGGERRIQVGPQYAASAHAIPASIHYAALGHVHRPQEVPGAAVRARYAGSLLQLDFSERTHRKEVVLVEASAHTPPKVWSQQLAAGRQLLRVEDTMDQLRARTAAGEFTDAYLDVRVITPGPVFGIADEVRTFLPDAVLAQAKWQPHPTDGQAAGGGPERSLAAAYAEFHALPKSRGGYEVAASEELIAAVRELEEEVLGAAP